MTVQELIEELKKFRPDCEVTVEDQELVGYTYPVGNVEYNQDSDEAVIRS